MEAEKYNGQQVNEDRLKQLEYAETKTTQLQQAVSSWLEKGEDTSNVDKSFAHACVQHMLAHASTTTSFLAQSIIPDLQVFADLAQHEDPVVVEAALLTINEGDTYFYEEYPLQKFMQSVKNWFETEDLA